LSQDNKEKYLGMAEASRSIGMVIGTIIGGPIYEAFGFFWNFISFCGFFFICLLVTIFLMPSAVNNSFEQDPEEKTYDGDDETVEVQASYKMFFVNKRSIFCWVSMLLTCFLQ
jgi:MFS family permease